MFRKLKVISSDLMRIVIESHKYKLIFTHRIKKTYFVINGIRFLGKTLKCSPSVKRSWIQTRLQLQTNCVKIK